MYYDLGAFSVCRPREQADNDHSQMLSDDVELRNLASRYRGLCRPVQGDLAIFFEHVAAARNFALDARAAGYLIDLAGTEAYVHASWSRGNPNE